MRDKISVLICAYNTQETLWKCARSAVLQKYRPLQIIIVDDGSTDKTGNVADFLAERYKEVKVIHQANKGVAAARNRAIEEADGDWIFFLDSDDTMAEGALETMMENQKRFNADLVIGAHKHHLSWFSWRSGIKRAQMMNAYELSKALLKDKEIKSYMWGKLVKSSLFKNIQFQEGKVFEDIRIMEKLILKAQRVRVIPDIVYHYTVQRNGSITSSLSPDILPDYLDAERNQIRSILKVFPQLDKECEKAYQRTCLIVLISCLIHGEYESIVFNEAYQSLSGYFEM